MSDIKEPSALVRSLANSLIENITEQSKRKERKDAETGNVVAVVDTKFVDRNAVNEIISKELDIAMVKKSQELTSSLTAAATLACGELAVPILKKNKDITGIALSVPVLRDKIEVVVERERMVGGPGQEKTKRYGYTTPKYSVAANNNSGELKIARSTVSAMMAEALS